jgi:3-oxoacyl-[acyl-carrier protein] reductase
LDLGLEGARALVAGGSGGLGGAVGDALAAEGARVALVARASDRLTDRAAAIGGLAVPADLSTPGGPAAAVAATVAAHGGLDVVFVNSGGPPPGTFDDLADEDWQRAIDGTLWSALRLIRAAIPHLRASDRPAFLVNLSSSAREPIPGLTTSNLLRPGLAGLIKSLVPEIAPIRINGLAPGRLGTDRIVQLDTARAQKSGVSMDEIRRQTIERIPLGRYGDPAELGRVAAFLLSPAASYVSGAIVPVDGGMIRARPCRPGLAPAVLGSRSARISWMARFFDIDAANAALPELRTILETLRDERGQLIELRDEFARRAALEATESGESAAEAPGPSGSASVPGPRAAQVDEASPGAEERRRLRLRMQGVIDQMQAGVARIDELGVTLREIETGLIDFPALVAGRQVWLCWRLGEGDVDAWHELSEGFGGRRPLAELT